MNENIRATNLRFNLDKEIPRKAWDYLQAMDKNQFKSYNQAITYAIVAYFEHQNRTQADPYFETREREERFVQQIVAAVEAAMEKSLPVFLAGCMAGMTSTGPVQAARPVAPPADPAPDLDWGFLGG